MQASHERSIQAKAAEATLARAIAQVIRGEIAFSDILEEFAIHKHPEQAQQIRARLLNLSSSEKDQQQAQKISTLLLTLRAYSAQHGLDNDQRKDLQEAKKWYEQAITQCADPSTMYLFASLYDAKNSNSVLPRQQAIELLAKAFEAGHANAIPALIALTDKKLWEVVSIIKDGGPTPAAHDNLIKYLFEKNYKNLPKDILSLAALTTKQWNTMFDEAMKLDCFHAAAYKVELLTKSKKVFHPEQLNIEIEKTVAWLYAKAIAADSSQDTRDSAIALMKKLDPTAAYYKLFVAHYLGIDGFEKNIDKALSNFNQGFFNKSPKLGLLDALLDDLEQRLDKLVDLKSQQQPLGHTDWDHARKLFVFALQHGVGKIYFEAKILELGSYQLQKQHAHEVLATTLTPDPQTSGKQVDPNTQSLLAEFSGAGFMQLFNTQASPSKTASTQPTKEHSDKQTTANHQTPTNEGPGSQ